MDLHETVSEGWQQANEQMIKFWWRSGSQIRIAALGGRALVEACTVPLLLVNAVVINGLNRFCYIIITIISSSNVIMAALCSRCGHYILSHFFFFFSSPNLSGRRLDVDHTSTHGVALVQI